MSGQASTRFSLAFVVLQSVWMGQPASAQVPLPADLIGPQVPHDVAAGSAASVQDLAIFAWQEFIALNWPALDPATSGLRGQPDTSAAFLTIEPDATGSYPLLVWQTYRHKNEVFPAVGIPSSFDSNPPSYSYTTSASGSSADTKYDLYNNLDETNEIGFCTVSSHVDQPAPNGSFRMGYEAKVNRAVFDYVYADGFDFATARTNATNTLARTGGTCELPANAPVPTLSLPCGDLSVSGDAGEGAMEIKAAWRKLTPAEQASGRFYTREVIYYQGGPGTASGGTQQYYNDVFGLVALHIIHKTKSFPTFVFATWEQVDNYDDANNTNSQDLAYIETDATTQIPVTRYHSIHSQVGPVNDAVHASFKQQAPNSVWQYYKLVGVQGTPVGQPSAQAPSDTNSYYYLANVVVETDQFLQNFNIGNVYKQGAQGSPFNMGGCQGCHGNQGQLAGGDFSAVLGAAPTGSNTKPDSLDTTPAQALAEYLARAPQGLANVPPEIDFPSRHHHHRPECRRFPERCKNSKQHWSSWGRDKEHSSFPNHWDRGSHE